jgi:hypothetical protein
MNRRDTQPYVLWCGRTAGASPPPTRLRPAGRTKQIRPTMMAGLINRTGRSKT